MINSANEYEPDVQYRIHYFFAQHRFKNSKFYNECMSSLDILQRLKDNYISLNITTKELIKDFTTEVSLAL